jgi:uncharacterized protein with von Willebrand factor type A (vWA) domain
MVTCIGQLDPRRNDFGVVFLAEKAPLALGDGNLLPPSGANKTAAIEFLKKAIPSGQTDPLPGLERAFDTLDKTASAAGGKIIFLLTDDDFPDSDAVVKLINKRNAKKDVHIFTVLVASRDKPPEKAQEMMKKIATENGGKYKFVNLAEE